MAPTREPELILVDPDGDLILKVGSQDEVGEDEKNSHSDDDSGNTGDGDGDSDDRWAAHREVKIRVCSKLMTMCSPVFKAMLNGQFCEGQLPLSSVEPPTLELPEDEPASMVKLCRILHHKWDTNLTRFPFRVVPVAVAADKYGCTAIVRSWFHHQHLQKTARTGGCSQLSLAQLVSIAYILDDVEAFYFFSLQAYRRWRAKKTDNEAFVSQLLRNHLPSKIHELLEQFAEAQLRELITCCQQMIDELFTCNDPSPKIHSYVQSSGREEEIHEVCAGQAYRTAHFIQALIAFGLWPPYRNNLQPVSVEDAIGVVQEISKTHINDKPWRCGDHDCDSCGMSWGQVIEDRVKRFEYNLHGICLVCLKKGEEFPASKITTKCTEHNHGLTSNWSAISGWNV